jgi:hypothetical protein
MCDYCFEQGNDIRTELGEFCSNDCKENYEKVHVTEIDGEVENDIPG